MRIWRSLAGLWIAALLMTGTALALVLLAQTIVTYRYVSRSLIQEGRNQPAGADGTSGGGRVDLTSSRWKARCPGRSFPVSMRLAGHFLNPERFASLFWCSFDPASGTLRYINAGDPPPLWMRTSAGTIERLSHGGPVLGLIEGGRYRIEAIHARAGDLLVLYSDGLVEATNDAGEFFGEDRLIDAARRSAVSASDL